MLLTASRSGHLFHGPTFRVAGVGNDGTREVLCTGITTRERAEFIARCLAGFVSFASITAEPDAAEVAPDCEKVFRESGFP